jgi:hypothetical protein
MVMQDFDASVGVAATRTNATITPARIGSVPLHYGAPEIARAITNHLKTSLRSKKCKLWLALKDNVAVAFTHGVA